MKVCSKCKVEKEMIEFHKGNKFKDGLQYICKKCNRGIGYFNEEIDIMMSAIEYIKESLQKDDK